MIYYNLRHRGAFEYDKFALNILQLHNYTSDAEATILSEGSEAAREKQALDDFFELATGSQSLSYQAYKKSLLIME